MDSRTRRISREKKTVQAMAMMYCRSHHKSKRELCGDCGSLVEYALKRLDSCPLADDKPICSKCTVHCYEKTRRERMKEVMRYSGPRMLTRHPVMAFRHIVDGRSGYRSAPRKK